MFRFDNGCTAIRTRFQPKGSKKNRKETRKQQSHHPNPVNQRPADQQSCSQVRLCLFSCCRIAVERLESRKMGFPGLERQERRGPARGLAEKEGMGKEGARGIVSLLFGGSQLSRRTKRAIICFVAFVLVFFSDILHHVLHDESFWVSRGLFNKRLPYLFL